MTVLLALDSSTDVMALALTAPQGRWFFEADGGPKASEAMVPQALALLQRAGLALAEVDAIGFGRGLRSRVSGRDVRGDVRVVDHRSRAGRADWGGVDRKARRCRVVG